MAARGEAARHPSQRTRWAARLALVAGVGLVLIALPRIHAYLGIATWSDRVPAALDNPSIAIEPPVLADARADYCAAARALGGDAYLQQECARLAIRLSGAAGDGSHADERLAEAAASLRRMVAAAPNRGLGWSLLAAVEAARAAPSGEVAGLLRMSYLTAPREAASMAIRARLMLRDWDGMPEDLRSDAGRELALLWKCHALKGELVSIYLASDFRARAVIRRHALVTEADLAQFDARVRAAAAAAAR
ncbi:MAG: hypothetical protein WBG82_05755 [Parvibaculum sp.]|uniref:hypothetical protein n=1 Tax=Parvibaculum sp. TaxID=2024848 RepID=UPI003C7288B7